MLQLGINGQTGFQQVRDEQDLHEKASGKQQVVSLVSPAPLFRLRRRELRPPVPGSHQVLQLGRPRFGLCGSRLAPIIGAQDSCEGGLRRLDCRPGKLRGLSTLGRLPREEGVLPGLPSCPLRAAWDPSTS